MTQSKHTKRALLASILSVAVCCAMLIGTTFAWFTDSVSSGKNQIVAGNLDVDLLYSTDLSNWQSVQGETDLFSDNLWEPGHVEVVYLKVVNNGTLALDYELAATAMDTVIGQSVVTDANGTPLPIALSSFLQYAVIADVNAAFATRTDAMNAITQSYPLSGGYVTPAATQLLAGAETEPMALVIYMPSTVGNEANSLTGTPAPEVELGVTVRAKQSVHESDSFDNTYDAAATYNSVKTEEELRAAVQKGGTIELMNDIALSQELYLKDVPALVLDGNGYAITADDDFAMNLEGQWNLVKIETAANVTLNDITLRHSEQADATGNYHTLDVYGSPAVTLSDVTLERDIASGKGGAAMVLNGSQVIVTGAFHVSATGNSWYGVDVDAKNGTSNLNVQDADVTFNGTIFALTENGGTITCDPSEWYIVSDSVYYPAAASVDGTTYPTLEAAVTAATSGQTILVRAGVHTMPDFALGDRTLTLQGEEGTVLVPSGNADSDAGALVIMGCNGGTLTVKNIAFSGADSTVQGRGICFSGQQNENATLVVENCTFDSLYAGAFLGGVKQATFTECAFTNSESGTAIGGTEDITVSLTVDRCTFGEGITETIGWAGQGGSQLIIKDSPTCENFADWTNGGQLTSTNGGTITVTE